ALRRCSVLGIFTAAALSLSAIFPTMGARDARVVGRAGVMRTCLRVLLCATIGAGLSGCVAIGPDPPPRVVSQPPADTALEKGVLALAQTVKWLGLVEASPVRQAHPLAPADWIVCAQSGARDFSPPYAMFFKGDTMVHFRIAVEVDDCLRVPYAPVATMSPVPVGGPLVGGPQDGKRDEKKAGR